MKKLFLLISALSALCFTAEAQKKEKLSKVDKAFLATQPDGLYAKLETSRGDIYVVFDPKLAPIAVSNFVGLAEGKIKNDKKAEGAPYYDGLIFHRVIPNFMIQGGCPLGTGSGDPGYKFPDEFDPSSEAGKKGYTRGVMAMANAGPNTNGSQFFLMHKDYNLPYSYTIFGHVVKGIETVDSIAATPRDAGDRPLQEQKINHVLIMRKGKEAEKFNAAEVFKSAQENIVKKKAEKEAKEKAEFQAMVDQLEKATPTASGLKYVIVKEGEGAKPGPMSKVTVHYKGMLMDGKTFDSSYDRGQTISFGLNQVIPGWTEGLQLMKPGGKAYFLIPPSIGYGERGAGGVIPPNATLIFQVELFKFE